MSTQESIAPITYAPTSDPMVSVAVTVAPASRAPKHGVRAPRDTRGRAVLGVGIAALAGLGAVVERLPGALIVPVMIVLLAGVDLVGAVIAKSWSHGAGAWMFLAGAATYVLLFWVYGVSLRHGELTTVTVGWVAVVTVGSMVLDRWNYNVRFGPSKWVAAAVVVALLIYLVTDFGGDSDAQPETGDTATVSVDITVV